MRHSLLVMTLLFSFILGATPKSLPPLKAVLFPFKEATIAAQVDGTLIQYNYRPGQKFEKDAVIATLDNRRFLLEQKKNQELYDFTQESLQEQKELLKKNFTSDFEVKKKEFELSTIKNTLEEVKLNLSYCTIKAPFSGKIEEVLTQEHETVRNSQPLVKIIDDHQLLALVNIPISDLEKFQLDKEVILTIPEVKQEVVGKVYEIMPRAEHRSGTIQIKILINNEDGKLTAGMTGEITNVK